MKRLSIPALMLLAACNLSKVREGDPLHAYVGTTYYLAMPLSGPAFRNANMFGQKPVLDAGTKVRVTSVERVPKAFDAQWLLTVEGIRTVEQMGYKHLYRVFFDGPEKCRPHGCQANWRVRDEAAFERRFETLFLHDDPLRAVPADHLALIRKHQVAGWMSLDEVLLSFGEPNLIVSSFGRDHWIYESRACDALGRLLSVPKVGLIVRGSKLEGHEALDAGDWYVLLDPGGSHGSCFNPYNGPGTGVARVDPSGRVVPGRRDAKGVVRPAW